MSIYIYECGDCGKREDYLVARDQNPTGYVDCDSSNLTRILEGQTFSAGSSSKSREKKRPYCGVCGEEVSLKNAKLIGIGLIGPFPMPLRRANPSDN